MDHDKYIRAELAQFLDGPHAHMTFDEAVQDFPLKALGKSAKGFEHTAWQLVEHMRIAQWDILEFSRDPAHVSPDFPKGYWPRTPAPAGLEEWHGALSKFRKNLQEMKSLILDTDAELWQPFAHGQGQTLFREALVLADHNAYHIGQIVALRKYLGI